MVDGEDENMEGDLKRLPDEYTDHYDGARVDEFWALYNLSR